MCCCYSRNAVDTIADNLQNQIETIELTPGPQGDPGDTPYIQDGYWYIAGNNTGVLATGPQGPAGDDGQDGAPGADGADGADGVGFSVIDSWELASQQSNDFTVNGQEETIWGQSLDFAGTNQEHWIDLVVTTDITMVGSDVDLIYDITLYVKDYEGGPTRVAATIGRWGQDPTSRHINTTRAMLTWTTQSFSTYWLELSLKAGTGRDFNALHRPNSVTPNYVQILG